MSCWSAGKYWYRLSSYELLRGQLGKANTNSPEHAIV